MNGFVFDDHAFIVGNPFLYNFDHIREILTGPVLTAEGPHKILNYYRPLVTLSFLLSYQCFGPVAFGFHLVSLSFHASVVVLLFLLVERLFRNRAMAFVAAGLFAIHPVNSESVLWISGLTDLEVTLFLLLAFWLFCSIPQPTRSASAIVQFSSLASFALALFSKEQAMLFPVLATIYEHAYRDDRAQTTWLQKALRYGAYWVVALVYLVIRIRALGSFAPVTYRLKWTLGDTVLSGLALFGEYATKLVWPAKLSVYYAFHKADSPLDPRVWAGLGALLCCLVMFLALWKRERLATFGIIWFLVTLSPVLNPLWIAGSAIGDRYLYLPSVGLCWVVGWVGSSAWERATLRPKIWRRAMIGGVVAVVALCAIRVVHRTRDWRTDLTLFHSALDVSPNAPGVRFLLGLAYWDRGNLQAAESQWLEVLSHPPADPRTWDYLGLLRLRQRRYGEAKECIQRGLAMHSNYALGHTHLAEVHLALGEDREAEQQLLTAISLSSEDSAARNRLGKFYAKTGQLAAAEKLFRQAMENSPNSESSSALGEIHLQHGALSEAQAYFQKALTLESSNSQAHFGLAAIYSSRGRIGEAISEYEAGLATDPFNSSARSELEMLRVREPERDPARSQTYDKNK